MKKILGLACLVAVATAARDHSKSEIDTYIDEMYRTYDLNRDGKISKKEMANFLEDAIAQQTEQ